MRFIDRVPRFSHHPSRFVEGRYTHCLTAIGIMLLFCPSQASANPRGGKIIGGEATITDGENITTIEQESSRVLIEWDAFDIDPDELTQFLQPGSDAIALNRILSENASQILGQLQANGGVWLVNPNGILFGADAKIDVHRLLATTADIADDDFLDGDETFDFSIASSNPTADITNEGSITLRENGLAGLVAPHVRNDGLIAGRLGQVMIGGAPTFTVDLRGDGMLQFELTSAVEQVSDPDQALIENGGTISADGGQVVLTAKAAADVVDNVINMDGVVEARSVALVDGAIVLSGGDHGTVNVDGRLDASGATAAAPGGRVGISGDTVVLADNAEVNVTGDAGGGTVQIGTLPNETDTDSSVRQILVADGAGIMITGAGKPTKGLK